MHLRLFISKKENVVRLGGLIVGTNVDTRSYDVFTDEPLEQRRVVPINIGPRDLRGVHRRSKRARISIHGAQATIAPRYDGLGFEVSFEDTERGRRALELLLERARNVDAPVPATRKKKRGRKKVVQPA